jgi:3'-phosphoadenosine 5'-phosphosulfate sulfotransferase (PAPS reductase)/FAD synthetase
MSNLTSHKKFGAKISTDLLRIRQDLPLEAKILLSERRIIEWYEKNQGDVYVAFSGGKDSTVLLDIVRRLYPKVQAVFVDTGLEYPEIRDFVKSINNVIWLKPKYTFKEVLEKYGYPVISKEQATYIEEYRNAKSEKTKEKRWNGTPEKHRFKIAEKWKFLVNAPFKISGRCCKYLKKNPSHDYEKQTGRKAILGMMATDSNNRGVTYQSNGCNMADHKPPQSWPIAFWREEDVWNYIKTKNIPYCKIYDTGIKRTGCLFCMFGLHLQKVNRFFLLKQSHPKLWNYAINKLGLGDILDYIGIEYGKKPFQTKLNME